MAILNDTFVDGILEANNLGGGLKQLICDAVYPVGSIYISMLYENPQTKFGGQ